MIPIEAIIWILFSHLVGDFILQSDNIAQKKSNDSAILMLHCFIYILCFFPFCVIYIPKPNDVVLFSMITLVSHFITDFTTSRMCKYFYKNEDRHNFFVTIGFDQFLHYMQLFLTFLYISKGNF
jgi:membrane-bound metal-dependent hydrolase YbcI (DUF457 family)